MYITRTQLAALIIYIAIGLVTYFAVSSTLVRLGVGSILVGVFLCMFVVYMLRLPAHARERIENGQDDSPQYAGTHWLEFLGAWVFGSLFVFLGCYWILWTVHRDPIPPNWWIAIVPATLLLLLYIPTWRYLRTL